MTGRWALVTGASDGIGVEFCKLLAARGYNLVLVARREQQLHAVAAQLSAAHDVATRVVPCDLAKAGAAQKLYRTTHELGIPVDFLVNNAGLLHNGYFDEIDLRTQEDLLAVNVVALTALTALTHLFVESFARRPAFCPSTNSAMLARTSAHNEGSSAVS